MHMFFLRLPLKDLSATTAQYYYSSRVSTKGVFPKCPTCQRYIAVQEYLEPPVVELEGWGDRWADFAFGTGEQLLLSWRAVECFKNSDLRGLKIVGEVEVEKVVRHSTRLRAPPRYYLVTLARSAAALDPGLSGLISEHEQKCGDCQFAGEIKALRRIALTPGTWSGEDMFICRGLPGVQLVTEKVVTAAAHFDLLGAEFIPTERCAYDGFSWSD